jgi:hypothetical protein
MVQIIPQNPFSRNPHSAFPFQLFSLCRFGLPLSAFQRLPLPPSDFSFPSFSFSVVGRCGALHP